MLARRALRRLPRRGLAPIPISLLAPSGRGRAGAGGGTCIGLIRRQLQHRLRALERLDCLSEGLAPPEELADALPDAINTRSARA